MFSVPLTIRTAAEVFDAQELLPS